MDYSIYDYNSDEKLLQEQEIEEINNVKMSLLNTLVTKLNNAGIYFNSTSRIKSESSLLHKLETGKYSMQEGGRKIQDIIGIRINLFYLEDMDICEKILEETFLLDNWSKTKNEENKFEAQKCNGVFRIPSKYLVGILIMFLLIFPFIPFLLKYIRYGIPPNHARACLHVCPSLRFI